MRQQCRIRVEKAIPFAIIILVATVLTWPVLSSPNDLYPSGIDALGHLSKVEQTALRWHQGEYSDWYPYWYNGAAGVQYYPPFSVWIPALFQFYIGDIRITFKVVCWLCIVFGGWAAYRLARRLGQNWMGATVCGVFYAASSYTLHTVLWWGTLGRALSLPLFPILMGSCIDLVEKDDTRRFLKVVFMIWLQILVHVMHAYFLFVCVGVVSLVWSFRKKDWWRSILTLTEAVILGALATAFWSVPGYVPLDIPGVPSAGPGGSAIHSMAHRYLVIPSSPVGHVGLLLFAVLGSISLLKRGSTNTAIALFLGLLIPLSFICGPKNPVYKFLPMSEALQPERFLNAAYLPAALLCGAFIGWDNGLPERRCIRQELSMFAIILLCMIETWVRHPFQPYTSYDSLTALVDTVDSLDDPFSIGRIATEIPRVNSEKAYFPSSRHINSIEGWNFEGSPHVYTFRNQNCCLGQGFEEYVLSNWDLWNVRYAIVDDRAPRLLELLEQNGWVKKAENDTAAIYHSLSPSSYFQELLSNVLVIGRSSFFVRRLLPGVSEARNPDPLSYSEEYTDLFDAVFLYDLPTGDAKSLETMIINWLKKGKRVIVDLSASSGIGSLFGVRVFQTPISGTINLSPDSGSRFGRSIALKFDDGAGAVYSGLDSNWLTCETKSGPMSVCGTRELQYGTVVFTGLHIPRLVTKHDKTEAAHMIRTLLAPTEISGFQTIAFQPRTAHWSGHGVEIEYEQEHVTPIVVSLTYTPRWHAYVDGVPIGLQSHQDLVLLNLPSGHHVLELSYEGSFALSLGWGITVVAVIATIFRIVLRIVSRKCIRAEVPTH